MKQVPAESEIGDQHLRAEFDLLADEYHDQHARNVAITGEGPEYFAEYKVADLAKLMGSKGIPAGKILDFGSGIGNSVPYFRKHFKQSELHCCDVSARSIEIAQTRFPDRKSIRSSTATFPCPHIVRTSYFPHACFTTSRMRSTAIG